MSYNSDHHYDHRKRGRAERGSRFDDGDEDVHDDRKRSRVVSSSRANAVDRSRSRSPDIKQQIERERQTRMAQLRAENDNEEAKLVALEAKQSSSSSAAHKFNGAEAIVQVDEADLVGLDEEEQMKMLLGFTGGFGSTKGQKVDSNQSTAAVGVAGKNKARKYRQYMNRKNGFNRPLDKMD
jgi:U4/U6.U5 tri-snRNP-associated protein 3